MAKIYKPESLEEAIYKGLWSPNPEHTEILKN